MKILLRLTGPDGIMNDHGWKVGSVEGYGPKTKYQYFPAAKKYLFCAH